MNIRPSQCFECETGTYKDVKSSIPTHSEINAYTLEITEGADFLIPIPSRNSVARKRGRQFVSVLSRKISESEGLPTEELLTHIRKVRDQSNLDAKDRAENLEGALVSLRFISGRAILVDDLVTTGATLREAARALRAVGIVVSAAVTACVAEPLR
jgi:predicted amidophosphoribosyltransferase